MYSTTLSNKGRLRLYVLICFAVVIIPSCSKAGDAESAKRQLQMLRFNPPAYQKEVLRVIIDEANRVARELSLPEKLPITETNLIEAYITPPRMAHGMKALGNITTENYAYFISVDYKFSFLVRTRLDPEYVELKSQYLWPTTRMNTNTAYQVATQFLVAASMDVRGLERDCHASIRAFTPEGKTGQHFVPVYWVSWTKEGRVGAVAEVELFLPTKTIRQMHVNEAKYILRRPLVITNLDFLLSQTNAPLGQ